MENNVASQNPEDWSTLLLQYVLDDLSATERQAVEHSLAENPVAQAELALLEESLAAMPLALPLIEPPPELRSRVLQTVTGTATAAETVNAETVNAETVNGKTVNAEIVATARSRPANRVVPKRQSNLGPWISGAIAAGLLAVMGWQNYRLSRQVASLRQEVAGFRAGNQMQLAQSQATMEMLRQPDNRLISLRGTVDQSVGSLLVFRTDKKATLNLQNVPTPPDGQTYRLWALMDGQKIYCTEFKPNERGQVSVMIPMEQTNEATTIAVTIEPKEASTEVPIGTMVMNGSVSL
jgi:anti-sigma-K factor RskA